MRVAFRLPVPRVVAASGEPDGFAGQAEDTVAFLEPGSRTQFSSFWAGAEKMKIRHRQVTVTPSDSGI